MLNNAELIRALRLDLQAFHDAWVELQVGRHEDCNTCALLATARERELKLELAELEVGT